ncbi:MAG: DnaJ domain-containing protein [Bryobacteraceae bacterium]
MTRTQRQYHREPADFPVALNWKDASGKVSTMRPRALDISQAGVCLECAAPIAPGLQVYLEVARFAFPLEAVVRYSMARDTVFRIGVEFSDSTKRLTQGVGAGADYYEALQLSPKADIETIHRVYRIMATRFHPDNAESGDQERFLLLAEAYRVLGNPDTRARYDSLRETERPRPLPMFQTRAFVDEQQGERNRRLGVLCLLYAQRQRNYDHPSVSLLELEELMAIPREHLEFTLWYLKAKKYVEMNQGADFSLTAGGVDFVEEHTPAHAMMRKLLQGGAGGACTAGPDIGRADHTDLAHVQ